MANFEIATAIMITAVIYFLYKASVELDERHWQFKMGLFYAALGIGWAGLNVVLRMAQDAAATSGMTQAITAVYGADTTIGVLAVIYLGIRFLSFTFHKFLAVANRKESEESKQAW